MSWTRQDCDDLVDAIASHVLSLGVCDRVNKHEPKSAPGNGVSAGIWLQGIRPLPEASSLISTSGLVTVWCQLYGGMLKSPMDQIDPELAGAASTIIASISADFSLDGMIRDVDLLGEFSDGLKAEGGYLTIDHTMFRIFTLTIPCVINDMWEQAP